MQNQLLDMIVCPVCHAKLSINKEETILTCSFDNISFPIKEGIPILLVKKSNKYEL